MDLLTWVLFGLIAGIVANVIDPYPARGGILGAVVLGILGAMVGGFLANMVLGTGVSGFNLYSFFIAVGGALFLLLIARALRSA